MSNTFMDALMDPGHKKAPPKQAKKRSTLNLKPSTSVIPSVMVGYSSISLNCRFRKSLLNGSSCETNAGISSQLFLS